MYRDDFTVHAVPGKTSFARAERFFETIDFTLPDVLSAGTIAISVLRMTQVTLLRVVAPKVTFYWRRRRSAARERRVFILVHEGRIAVEGDGIDGEITPSNALVIDRGSVPVRFTFLTPSTQVYVLSADRNVLDPRFLNRADRLTFFSPEHPSFKSTLTAMLDTTIASVPRDMSPALVGGFTTILTTAANALSAQCLEASPENELDLFDEAMTAIELGSSDRALNPAQLAKTLGVALRTLQKRFEAAGTSIAAEIRRSRVRSAVQILRAEPTTPLEAIAKRVGFASAQVLRAGLRAETGETASSLRAKD